MIKIVQKYVKSRSAVKIAEEIEWCIHQSKLKKGDKLPSIRGLASLLEVSPGTVVSAYDVLRHRGYVTTRGRNGTIVTGIGDVASSTAKPLSMEGVLDLSSGNPDPSLLPGLAPFFSRLDATPVLYDEDPNLESLVSLFRRSIKDEGVQADKVCVTSGALDALSRVFEEHLKPGDKVAVEDPCFTGILDILYSRSLVPIPVPLDREGITEEGLKSALQGGISALVVTPRAQNPTGIALSKRRAKSVRAILKAYPDLLLIEDDHAGPVAGAPYHPLISSSQSRWSLIRSVSKYLGPDLRLAFVAGDELTMSRMEARQYVGSRWVSKILQQLVLLLLQDKKVERYIKKSASMYQKRRESLCTALERKNIPYYGSSGYNLWIPVHNEALVCQNLYSRGYCVTPGTAFRLEADPGIRVTHSCLEPEEAAAFVEVLFSCMQGRGIQAV